MRVSLILLSLLVANPVFEARADLSQAKESKDRATDEVALSVQLAAAKKFAKLANQYKDTPKEPPILIRWVETLQKASELSFRLAYQNVNPLSEKQRLQKVKEHESIITRGIDVLTFLIQKFPRSTEITRAYYYRADFFRALNKNAKAIDDFKVLVDQYPGNFFEIQSTVAIAEIAMSEKNYPLAVQYLEKLKISPGHQQFNYVREKLATAYYQQGKISDALRVNEERIQNLKRAEDSKARTSELTKALQASAIFYSRGIELEPNKYTLDGALPYFKSTSPDGFLGKSLLAFTMQLRGKEWDVPLREWCRKVLPMEPVLSEQAEVFYQLLEYQIRKRQHAQINESLNDYIQTASYRDLPQNKEVYERIRKLLLNDANTLQKVAKENTNPVDVQATRASLVLIFDIVLRISKENDPDLPRVHYNLAETLFNLKQYDRATDSYRWVATHPVRNRDDEKLPAESAQKAIGSRYETLREAKLIPESLTPKSPSGTKPRQLPPKFADWLSWTQEVFKQEQSEPNTNFYFESARALYVQDHIDAALDRLGDIVDKAPSSKYAIPSAALILDTHIAGKDWAKTEELAQKYRGYAPWKTGEFSEKLKIIAADSSLKLLESAYQNKQYKEALAGAESYLSRYGENKNRLVALKIAGGSSVELGLSEVSLPYLSKIIQEAPQTPAMANALFNRAIIHENLFNFGAAAVDLTHFLTLHPNLRTEVKYSEIELRQKVLHFSWISGDTRLFANSLKSDVICGMRDNSICERYTLIKSLSEKTGMPSISEKRAALAKAERKAEPERFLWAVAALDSFAGLHYGDLFNLIQVVSEKWEKEDSLSRAQAVERLIKSIPAALENSRIQMERLTKLRLDEKSIASRALQTREFEQKASFAVKIPLKQVQAAALAEVAKFYANTAESIQGLVKTQPKLSAEEKKMLEETLSKIQAPFLTKAQEVSLAAFQLVAENAVDFKTADSIATVYLKTHPSETLSFQHWVKLVPMLPAPGFQKEFVAEYSRLIDAALFQSWKEAVEKKQFPRAWFIIGKATQTRRARDTDLELMKGITLVHQGVNSEGLASVMSSVDRAPQGTQDAWNTYALRAYFRSYSKKKTREYWTRSLPSTRELRLAHYLMGLWNGNTIAESEFSSLIDEIRRIPENDRTPLERSFLERSAKGQVALSEGKA